jgi:hypothetical protein
MPRTYEPKVSRSLPGGESLAHLIGSLFLSTTWLHLEDVMRPSRSLSLAAYSGCCQLPIST